MKMEITLDGNQLGGTIEETFKHLTSEQMKEIAKGVATQWFTELNDIPGHQKAFEESLIDKFRTSDQYNAFNKSDEEIRRSYDFKHDLRGYKNPQGQIITKITDEVLKHIRDEVKDKIQKDDFINELISTTVAEIKKDFPKFVHDAITAFFCSHMQSIGDGIQLALTQSSSTAEILKQITEKLGIQNPY